MACSCVGLSRRSWYRGDPALRQASADAPVEDGLNALVERHPRWGFWKMFHALRLEGHRWNHKCVAGVLRDEAESEAARLAPLTR